jgi:hypothetical protein
MSRLPLIVLETGELRVEVDKASEGACLLVKMTWHRQPWAMQYDAIQYSATRYGAYNFFFIPNPSLTRDPIRQSV